MRPISRILSETRPGPKPGLSDLQTRTLIAVLLILFLFAIHVLLRLLMRQCGGGRSVDCPSNPRRCRTRSRAYEHVLEKLPVISYARPATSEADTCPICLAEYEEGESVRVLPRCKHFLHRECIDEWLLRSFKCPMCRAPIAESRAHDASADEDRRIMYHQPSVTSAVARSLI